MIESVVFDMDGVLFDTEKICTDAWHQTGTEMNIADIHTTFIACVGRNETDTRQFFIQKYGRQFPYEQFRQRTSRMFYTILDREGLPVKEGVMELLEFLKSGHYRIALATSTGRTSTLRYLQDTGIISYFQTVITGDMIRHGKPDPEIYRTACRKLGSLPASCIAIEDSPNGIRSAFGAGMKPVMVPDLIAPTEEIEELLFAKCRTLSEVKVLLQNQPVGHGPSTQ